MTRQVAFLRAINVGGRAVVRMSAVQAAFQAAGCRNVTTYIQSGNVMFDAPASDEAALRRRVAGEMRTLLGSEPVVVSRSVRSLQLMVTKGPFGALASDPRLKLYVAFLSKAPTSKPGLPLRQVKEALEAIGMRGQDVFIVSRPKPNGFYGFPANWIEREFGVPATARNWTTVTKLVALARSG